MIELFVSLFSTVGAAGFGSALKLVAGFIQNRHEARLASEAAKNPTSSSSSGYLPKVA